MAGTGEPRWLDESQQQSWRALMMGITLLHALRRRGARRGLASLCVSGGMGMAAAFESMH